jgi:branched-subunit amino acid aminotransferase/4-amino-4-deoxychorismate lyase
MQATQKIWMDGQFVDWDKAQVHVLSHTLHYGLGVFEGIRCYDTTHGPAIFRLREHIERLFHSVHIAGIKMAWTQDDIQRAIIDTVKINQCASVTFVRWSIWAMVKWVLTTVITPSVPLLPYGHGGRISVKGLWTRGSVSVSRPLRGTM